MEVGVFFPFHHQQGKDEGVYRSAACSVNMQGVFLSIIGSVELQGVSIFSAS
jgi:hypothetical protein